MRITIEPTTDQSDRKSADAVNHKVVIEHPWDELNVDELMPMVVEAVVAYGYARENIENWLQG